MNANDIWKKKKEKRKYHIFLEERILRLGDGTVAGVCPVDFGGDIVGHLRLRPSHRTVVSSNPPGQR